MALEDQFDLTPQEPADFIQRDHTGPILFWILKRPRASPRELDDFRFGHRRLFPKAAERLDILRSGRTELDRHRECEGRVLVVYTLWGCRGMRATDRLGSWMYQEVVPHGDPEI
jgi:hypothetical protein